MQRLIISPLNSLDSFHIVIRTLIFQLLNIVNSFRHTSQESDIWLFKCSNICKFDTTGGVPELSHVWSLPREVTTEVLSELFIEIWLHHNIMSSKAAENYP